MRLWAVAAIALVLAGAAFFWRRNHDTAQKFQAAGENRTMNIKFMRSGGPAAFPGLIVDAAVDVNATQGKVTSKDGYARELAPGEAQGLSANVNPDCFFQMKNKDLAAKRAAGPNGLYQYDITLRLDGGREHSITVSDMMQSELERQCPGLGKFLDWAKQESQSVMAYKMRQR